MKKVLIFLSISLVALLAGAQELDENGFDPLSSKPIHDSDVMWKKSVIRRIDLREQQNQPLFSKENEISKLIIKAVREGVITPYRNDSLKTKLTIDEFLKSIQLPDYGGDEDEEEEEEATEESSDDWDSDDSWDEEPADDAAADVEETTDEVAAPAKNVEYFFPKDLYLMEIKENIVFDKQRSRQYYDIIAFNFFLSADHADNIKGIDIPLASFSYKELRDKLFKDNPDAIWYNPYNDHEHRNLADAFELRLFHGYIIKVSNPNDDYLIDIYGGDPKTGIMASQWKAFELLEYEHNLWEF